MGIMKVQSLLRPKDRYKATRNALFAQRVNSYNAASQQGFFSTVQPGVEQQVL